MGFEPLSAIDTTQLIHFATRQKRQNGQIWGIEGHGRYTALRFAIGRNSTCPVTPRPFLPLLFWPKQHALF